MANVQLEPFEACSFFHGTNAHLANLITQEGSTDYLGQIGAKRLAVDLWRQLSDRHGGIDGVVERLRALDCTFTTSVAMAMCSTTGEYPARNFEYGDLYVTLGLQRAAGFALRSPYGSELLGIIADMMRALRADGDDLTSLLGSFPELIEAFSEPTAPVVIEFSGISMHQAMDGDGDVIDQRWTAATSRLLDVLHPSNGACFDLRLRNANCTNVVCIYRLDRLSESDTALLRSVCMGDDDLEARIRCTADWGLP